MPKEQKKTLKIKAKAEKAERPKTKEQVQELSKIVEPKKLTLEQELFCQYYVTQEFFANGVKSYMQAYADGDFNLLSYNSAKESASRLLRDVNICQRINELLDLSGLSDQFVDKQMTFLITQNDELGTKLQAIKMYNDLRQRIKNRFELTGKDGGAIEHQIIINTNLK